jgi:hypothetical protein
VKQPKIFNFIRFAPNDYPLRMLHGNKSLEGGLWVLCWLKINSVEQYMRAKSNLPKEAPVYDPLAQLS